jgi:aromatic-L-amino-acid/L-tryptophan decarboxylase
VGSPMFNYDPQMTDLIFGYCRDRLALNPVPLDFPGVDRDLAAALDGLITASGNDAARVLGVFADDLAPAVISCDSPRFLSFIPAAPTKASLLFDMVVSCSSLQGTSWLEAAGAVAAENQVLRVLADLAGFPQGAGGVFVSGGSAGNLSALVVARDTARHRGCTPTGRPLVAVSDQAHSSIASALRVMGVGALVVPTVGHRLTGAGLQAALATAPDAGDVVAVVATSGTTNAGLIDDLHGIAQVARRHRLWLHVDGAYGGAALFSPQFRHRFRGLEQADSFVVDPHKWLFAPFDCASLIYREPARARAVHTQDASYLDIIHTSSVWNPSDYAYHLTRRARGLALWFSLAVHGTDAYGDAVNQALALAVQVAARITAAPHLELIVEPELSVVLFRRIGWGPGDYQAWTDEMLRTQIGFVTPTKWEGETVGRFAFLHPDTTIEMVDEMLALTV